MMGLSEFFKKTLKGAGFGAASGLAMALTEYVYLASTVPQFADAGELLTFGFGLAALFVLLGCVGGALLAAPLIPAAQAVRRLEGRFQGFARVLQHRALAWGVLGVSVACFFIFFVVPFTSVSKPQSKFDRHCGLAFYHSTQNAPADTIVNGLEP